MSAIILVSVGAWLVIQVNYAAVTSLTACFGDHVPMASFNLDLRRDLHHAVASAFDIGLPEKTGLPIWTREKTISFALNRDSACPNGLPTFMMADAMPFFPTIEFITATILVLIAAREGIPSVRLFIGTDVASGAALHFRVNGLSDVIRPVRCVAPHARFAVWRCACCLGEEGGRCQRHGNRSDFHDLLHHVWQSAEPSLRVS